MECTSWKSLGYIRVACFFGVYLQFLSEKMTEIHCTPLDSDDEDTRDESLSTSPVATSKRTTIYSKTTMHTEPIDCSPGYPFPRETRGDS